MGISHLRQIFVIGWDEITIKVVLLTEQNACFERS